MVERLLLTQIPGKRINSDPSLSYSTRKDFKAFSHLPLYIKVCEGAVTVESPQMRSWLPKVKQVTKEDPECNSSSRALSP